MPRPSNKIERRKQIVEGLLDVMSHKGYENASIQEIGKSCGLTPGLVHYHFKNKQDILVALIRSLSSIAQERYEGLLETANTPKQRLEAFIDSSLELGEGSDTKAVSAWVIIGSEAIRQPEVQVLYQQIIERNKKELMSLLTDFADESSSNFDKTKIEGVAMMGIAAIEGAYQLATSASKISPSGYAANTLKLLIFRLFE